MKGRDRTRSENTNRQWKIIIVTAVTAVTLLGLAGVSSADSTDPYVYVSDVTYSTESPETGDSVTVTPTVHHSSNGGGGVEVNEVLIFGPDNEIIAEANDLGVIGAGDSVDVPLRVSFDEAGDKNLKIKVNAENVGEEDSSGNHFTVEYPVIVSVSEPSSPSRNDPRLRIDSDDFVAGVSDTVTVSVSNGDDSAIEDLSLVLESDDASVEPDTRIVPRLGAWNSTEFVFDVAPFDDGSFGLKATLDYGDSQVSAEKNVHAEPLEERVDVHASLASNSSELIYRVTNYGNAPLENVSVTGDAGRQLPVGVIGTVAPSSSETVTVGTAGLSESDEVSLEASYTVGRNQGSVNATASLARVTHDDDEAVAPISGLGGFLTSLVSSPVSLGQILVIGVLTGTGWYALRRRDKTLRRG